MDATVMCEYSWTFQMKYCKARKVFLFLPVFFLKEWLLDTHPSTEVSHEAWQTVVDQLKGL